MAKPKPDALMDTIKAKREALIIARDQARMQLNGLENQLYILDQLLNPIPEGVPTEEETTNGVEIRDGDIL